MKIIIIKFEPVQQVKVVVKIAVVAAAAAAAAV